MDAAQFIDQLKEVLEMEDEELTLDTEFRSLELWDSLAYLSTIAMIDDEYGVIVSAAEFNTLKTVGDIAKAIEAKL